jgi:hypothetical protein
MIDTKVAPKPIKPLTAALAKLDRLANHELPRQAIFAPSLIPKRPKLDHPDKPGDDEFGL